MSTDDRADPAVNLHMICQTQGDQNLVALARANGLGAEAADAVAAIDAVMAKVRRSVMRREYGRQLMAALDSDLDVAHLDVIGAIGHGPTVWGEAGPEEVTVGLIAERLAIDPSRASRLSAEVVERGYVRRVASQLDARRICLELTPKGKRFVEAVRQNKWNRLASALGQWNEADLVTFALLFERFSGWATDSDGIHRSAEAIRKSMEADERAENSAFAEAK
ncbi:MarR family winged helix-turn-helix transcriptional regulator [Devosia sp.]|uniref:MarR family winged helix-turn-helix transcriptional regulator n=1 Tax=Devosia sp. TaxID=1871048 RepID=UPI003BA96C83